MNSTAEHPNQRQHERHPVNGITCCFYEPRDVPNEKKYFSFRGTGKIGNVCEMGLGIYVDAETLRLLKESLHPGLQLTVIINEKAVLKGGTIAHLTENVDGEYTLMGLRYPINIAPMFPFLDIHPEYSS